MAGVESKRRYFQLNGCLVNGSQYLFYAENSGQVAIPPLPSLSTIGYGHIAPISVAVNIIATVEAYLSLLMLAVMTGAVFSEISRPTAKVIFSNNAIVALYRDITGLQVRLANARSNQLINTEAKMILAM